MNKEQIFFWFIGLFEGEGSFTIYKGKAKRITITSTDEDVLLKVQKEFGGSIIQPTIRNVKWKQEYVWYLSRTDSYGMVSKMIPFLLERRAIRGKEWLHLCENQIGHLNELTKIRKEKREMIKLLFNEGLTHKEIGDKVGYERSHITKLLKTL